MNNYDVEMCYGFGVSLNIDANSKEEAIEIAKQIVKEEVSINEGFDNRLIDCGCIEFEQVTFINKK